MATKAKPQKPSVQGRTLDEVIAGMPRESQMRIAERSAELHAEVEGLKAFAQARPAHAGTDRPEPWREATGRRQNRAPDRPVPLDAAGSSKPQAVRLELCVELPGNGVMHLTGMGDLNT